MSVQRLRVQPVRRHIALARFSNISPHQQRPMYACGLEKELPEKFRFRVWGLFSTKVILDHSSQKVYMHSYPFCTSEWWIPFCKQWTTSIFITFLASKSCDWASTPLKLTPALSAHFENAYYIADKTQERINTSTQSGKYPARGSVNPISDIYFFQTIHLHPGDSSSSNRWFIFCQTVDFGKAKCFLTRGSLNFNNLQLNHICTRFVPTKS